MNCSVRWRICSPIRNGPRAEPRGDLAAACSRATACTRALGRPKPRKLSDASLMITLPTLDLWLLEDVASCREHPGQNETALQIVDVFLGLVLADADVGRHRGLVDPIHGRPGNHVGRVDPATQQAIDLALRVALAVED